MRLAVFAGSSTGRRAAYRRGAEALGQALAARQIELVYGGAQLGLMGVVADACLAAGGRVIGVLPETLDRIEIGHRGLTELHIVTTMHERKALMADLSEGFIALPGGLGSLEELFEVWTWTQLGIHRKPLGLLNVEGFYDSLVAFVDQQVEEAFVKPEHRGILASAADPDVLIDAMQAAELPEVPKWIDP